MDAAHNKYIFVIGKVLKTTRPGVHIQPLEYWEFEDNANICVNNNLNEYVERTRQLRKRRSQLLISYVKPYAPVSKSIIARWCKVVLGKAGIDITMFGAHSVRSASTSAAKRKGLPIEIIISAAGWSNESTCERYYNKKLGNTLNFGQTLLS